MSNSMSLDEGKERARRHPLLLREVELSIYDGTHVNFEKFYESEKTFNHKGQLTPHASRG